MFIHLLTPRGLSWTRNGVPKTDEAHDRLKEEKLKARPEDLCKGLPSEFEEFLRYCRRLKFTDCPDYGKWQDEFRGLAISEGFPNSDEFVWPPPKVESNRPLNCITYLFLRQQSRHLDAVKHLHQTTWNAFSMG